MSTVPPPNPREFQEFQFKLLARLRLFKDQNLPLKQSLNLVAAASKFGLICVGTSNGFDVIETAKIIELCAGVKKPAAEFADFPRRSVSLGAQPSHLDISCDCQHLAVGFTVGGAGLIRIYDVTSLTAVTEQVVSEVRLPAPLQALSWNPGIPNFLAACMQDGSASVYEFKNNSFELNSIPPEAQAICLSWSPKGKQIVVGSKNGTLNQFKPELKIVKSIPPPDGVMSVVSVHWLSNFQYAAVYCAHSGGPSLVVVNTPRNLPVTYINYEDITYSNGDNRLTQFYFIHQQIWNVLLVASANSMEVGVLGLTQAEWEQWQMEDMARAELPLSPSKQETHPVGMALDTSVQYSLAWGENRQLPPMPLLLLLSHEGLLTLYWTVNLLPDAAAVCAPPTPLLDTSGLHLFKSPQSQQHEAPALGELMTSPQTQVVAAVPVATATSTPQPQWQLPPSTSQPPWIPTVLTPPRAESKPESSVLQGTWMTSTAFISSTTSAFSAASSVFSMTSSATAPSAFSATSAAPPVSSVAQSSQFFTSPQTSEALFNKPGAFVPSSAPAAVIHPPLTPISPVSAMPSQSKVEIPSVPSPVLSPVSTPSTPDLEVSEESQELKAMNDALIQEALREEISHFDRELSQLSHRVRNININVLNDEMLKRLAAQVDSLFEFMEELMDTTGVQDAEVKSLRTFMVECFAYVENMKTRIHLQGNEDYMSLRSPMGLDPIQSRKMFEIKSNLQFIDSMLVKISNELSDKWLLFQESNKENREVMQIPSLEFIYQSMVMHNNVLLGQKDLLDNLEAKIMTRTRKKLLNLLSVSRMIEDGKFDIKDTEFSKITEDFLSLNLNKSKAQTSIEELQESVLNLDVSDSSLSNFSSPTGEMASDRMMLLKQVFSDDMMKNNSFSKRWFSPVPKEHVSMLPIVTSTPRTGSISSGQPVSHSSAQRTPIKAKEKNVSPALDNIHQSPLNNQIKFAEESKHKSPFSMPSSTASSMSFNINSSKAQINQTTIPSFAKNGENITQSSPQNVQTSSVNVSLTHGAITSQSIMKSSPTVTVFSESSITVSTAPVITQQTAIVAPTPPTGKPFSFTSIATSQAPSPFSSSSSFGSSSINPPVFATSFPQPSAAALGKTSSFGSTVSTSSPVPSTTMSFGKIEIPKTQPPSAIYSPFTVGSSESTFIAKVSAPPGSSSPLASLSTFVSGIEPLKPTNEITSSPNKVLVSSETASAIKTTPNQPFVFKVSNTSENKTSPGKETGVFTQKTNVFGLPVENKSEIKEPVSSVLGDLKANTSEIKNQFSGAFKKLSFESLPPKSIFGGTPPSNLQGTEASKSDQVPKTVFGLPNTTPTNLFGNSNTSASSSPGQKTTFSGTVSQSVDAGEGERKAAEIIRSEDSQTEGNYPIIEVSLTLPRSESDKQINLEKLSTAREITITKVESSEQKITGEESQSEGDSTARSLFSSINLSSFTTPTKSSPSIFGGTSPGKSSIMYEVTKPEPVIASLEEQKTQNKSVEVERQPETTKPQSLFGGATATKTTTSTSFSFSTSTLQNAPSSAPSSQSQQSSGFTFGIKLLTDSTITSTSPSTTTTAQAPSSFSFAQTETQSASTTFSFAVPTTTTPTTATSTFGFGTLATGFTDDKSKTGFSFGQQSQSPASTSANIFGGFSNKPAVTSSIFGQTTATTAENKSIFGQSPSGTPETKNVFRQSPTTSAETKSIFGQALPSATENKGIFGLTPTSAEENKNIFGQSTNTTETKSIFGQTPTSVETKSIFGQTSSTTENQNIFGQTPATSANTQPEFSFSLPTSTTTAQSSFFGNPAATTAGFFGQPICSPTSTASSPFGQPTTTPSVFGNTSASPFGGTSGFGSKPTFGQSGGSFFSQSSGGFGSSSAGSLFGGSSTPVFGSSNVQPAGPFGQSTGGSGSIFGGGSFSSGGQTVGQTGFGTPGFQNKPAFGSSSTPAFGAAPAFGGSPAFGGTAAFGSPQKPFGSPTPSSSIFGGTSPQQSPTFENLATQNTMTFGNLAQNQAPGFGSMFPAGQSNPPPPAFPPTNTGSVFGGSSFSSWR